MNVRGPPVLCLRGLWPLPVPRCVVAELAVDFLGRPSVRLSAGNSCPSLGDSARSQFTRCEVHDLRMQLRMALACPCNAGEVHDLRMQLRMARAWPMQRWLTGIFRCEQLLQSPVIFTCLDEPSLQVCKMLTFNPGLERIAL